RPARVGDGEARVRRAPGADRTSLSLPARAEAAAGRGAPLSRLITGAALASRSARVEDRSQTERGREGSVPGAQGGEMQTRQPMTLVLAGLLALGGCASSQS